MSAFLGHIHYLLYGKIKFQSDFCDFLINKAKEKGNAEVSIENIEEGTTKLPVGDLQDILDLSNIHGSLQNMIIDVENRLVFIVNEFETSNILSKEEILDFSFEYGKINSFESSENAMDVYSKITGIVLNGMPCDRVQMLIEDDDNYVKWVDRIDLHEEFWSFYGRSSSEFYEIRSQIIRGLISKVDVEFSESENREYELKAAV